MTRYTVKGFTACNQHLFTEVVKQSPYDAVMVALTTHVDVRETV